VRVTFAILFSSFFTPFSPIQLLWRFRFKSVRVT